MEPGVTLNVPVDVVALPVRDTPTDGSDALELSESVALAVPVVDGVNVTERLVLPPAAKVYGKISPLTLKPVPLTVALEMVRLDPPELDKLSSFVWLVPIVTVPRFMLEGAVKSYGNGQIGTSESESGPGNRGLRNCDVLFTGVGHNRWLDQAASDLHTAKGDVRRRE